MGGGGEEKCPTRREAEDIASNDGRGYGKGEEGGESEKQFLHRKAKIKIFRKFAQTFGQLMGWIEIGIGVILVLAAVQGWRQGMVVQVIGLAAVVAGVWLAMEYAQGTGMFVAIMVGVILVTVLVGRLTRGMLRLVGLGVFDNILGALFSVAKVGVVIWVIMKLAGIEGWWEL